MRIPAAMGRAQTIWKMMAAAVSMTQVHHPHQAEQT